MKLKFHEEWFETDACGYCTPESAARDANERLARYIAEHGLEVYAHFV